MTTLDIQRRLKALGFDPGPIDGINGRLTMRAIRAFQTARGLSADGIAGAETLGALAGGVLPLSQPSPARGEGAASRPWFQEAVRLKGTKEAAGGSDNSAILRWAKSLGLAYGHDSIAWCGLFVAHCIGATLPDEPLPANPLGARNWIRFGKAAMPTEGAVLVLWRGSKSSAKGHVGFYAGEDASAFHVLGGNQSDCVSIARVAKARLLGARWPLTAPPPIGGRTMRAESGALSTNEA